MTATNAFSDVRLRHPQVQGPHPGFEFAVAIAVPVGLPPFTAFIAASADHAFDIMLHQRLKHAFRHSAQKIALVMLLK